MIKEVYDLEDVLELDKNNTLLISLTYDKIIKAIFMYDLNWLKKFTLLQLPIELDFDDIKLTLLNNELPVESKNEYRKTVDIIVSLNDNLYVNLEINRQKFKYVKTRNYYYKNKRKLIMKV